MLKARVKLGNCLDVLKRFPDGTVDCIVTDPPYGLTPVSPRGKRTKASGGFMAAKWDVDVPSTKIWRECLRVLKPGAFAFIMCSPRQDCLAKLILRLQKAGFVIGYTSIYWIHSQGFGKAKNISKHLDKRAGVEREVVAEVPSGGGDNYDAWRSGEGRTDRSARHKRGTRLVTAPATEEAKRLNGSYAGYQPRPNLENIVVVMKPITETTYIDQTLVNRKGCTWLDDCRIPVNPSADATQVGRVMNRNKRETDVSGQVWGMNKAGSDRPTVVQPSGRVHANVLVQDDALRGAGQTMSVKSTKNHTAYAGVSNTRMLRGRSGPDNQHGDAGSVSRYFDLDAWFAERIGDLPESAQATFPFLYVAKPSRREKNAGLDDLQKRAKREVYDDGFNTATKVDPKLHTVDGMEGPPLHANSHPTVKSVKLMHYLVTLGSRPRDIVLDPFCGSGTTGVAAVTLKRNFYGIEQEPEYVEIAKARIRYARENRPDKTKRPEPKPPTKSLWGPKC